MSAYWFEGIMTRRLLDKVPECLVRVKVRVVAQEAISGQPEQGSGAQPELQLAIFNHLFNLKLQTDSVVTVNHQ